MIMNFGLAKRWLQLGRLGASRQGYSQGHTQTQHRSSEEVES